MSASSLSQELNTKGYIEFSLSKRSKYDLSTYLGRLSHFNQMTKITNLFYKHDTLVSYKNDLENYKKNPTTNLSKQQSDHLWEAKYICDSTFHPETGQKIPKLFRSYCFVPSNLPIAFGMLVLPATTFNIALFNLLNQTYNALMNYYTGSKSEDNMKYLLLSYSLAVSSSIGTGLLFKKLSGGKNPTTMGKIILIRVVPSAIAGFLNLFFMRSNCIVKGLWFSDEKMDKTIGVSKKVGIKATLEGAISRLFLPMPLIMNLFFVNFIEKRSKIKSNNVKNLLFTLSTGVCLGIGLPTSVSVFNQIGKYEVDKLEDTVKADLVLQKYKEKYIYYNKGL